MNLETSIQYFRPLPYRFRFRKYDQKLILQIDGMADGIASWCNPCFTTHSNDLIRAHLTIL